MWKLCTSKRQEDKRQEAISESIESCSKHSDELFSRVGEWVYSGDHVMFLENFVAWQKNGVAIYLYGITHTTEVNEVDMLPQAMKALEKQQVAMRYALATLAAIERFRKAGYDKPTSRKFTNEFLQDALNEPLKPSRNLVSQLDEQNPNWDIWWREP